MKRTPLARNTPLKANPQPTKRRPISPASPAQRNKVRLAPCICCDSLGPCDPAHLVSRAEGGDDDPRAVVPLCRRCHRAYDDGNLDLLPSLEPHFREELAYAVELVGLLRALERVTNCRWSEGRAA